MAAPISIAGRTIGPGNPPYVVAELSGNHKHDLGRAKELMRVAKEAGADAVKLQTYRPDTITIRSQRPEFVINGGLWGGRTLWDVYEEAHTPWEWHADLFDHGRELGITVFSSPFDDTAVELLVSLDAPAYKIASLEMIDHGLLKTVAATGKPVIVSTGIATFEEIEEAAAVLRDAQCHDVIFLSCVSAYPSEISDSRLQQIPDMARRLDVLTGLSDHSLGSILPAAAIALGACFIEKHLTLSRDDGGIDSAFSLEPAELAELCRVSRGVYEAIGPVEYGPKAGEETNTSLRRSLYFVADVAAGDEITRENLRSIRPGLGLAPKHLETLLGRRAKTAIECGTPASWDLVE